MIDYIFNWKIRLKMMEVLDILASYTGTATSAELLLDRLNIDGYVIVHKNDVKELSDDVVSTPRETGETRVINRGFKTVVFDDDIEGVDEGGVNTGISERRGVLDHADRREVNEVHIEAVNRRTGDRRDGGV